MLVKLQMVERERPRWEKESPSLQPSVCQVQSVQSSSDHFKDVNLWKTHFDRLLDIPNSHSLHFILTYVWGLGREKITNSRKKKVFFYIFPLIWAVRRAKPKTNKTIKSRMHPLSGRWADIKHRTYRTNRSSTFTLSHIIVCFSCQPSFVLMPACTPLSPPRLFVLRMYLLFTPSENSF